MVERQYEILKKERGKGQDDLKIKNEENGIQESDAHMHENGPTAKPEVSRITSVEVFVIHRYFCSSKA